jgi:hypothetical protein
MGLGISGLNWTAFSVHPPINPKNGDAYFNLQDNCTYIYINNQWCVLSKIEPSPEEKLAEKHRQLEDLKKYCVFKGIKIDEEEFNDFCDGVRVMERLVESNE